MGGVVTIGEALIALEADQKGSLGTGETFRRYLGGAEVNVAVALARLGNKVRWFGRLGADPFGSWVFRQLQGEGVEAGDLIFDPDHPTGIYFKEQRFADQINSYYYRKGSAGSLLCPEDLPSDFLEDAAWLHLTGITPALSDSARAATLAAATLAQEKAVKISFDPNLRLKLWSCEEAKETLTTLASFADLVLPGLDEGIALWGQEIGVDASVPWEKAAELLGQFLLSQGAGQVVVKMGASGALAVTREGSCFYPAFTLKAPVCTAGAGDAFATGLLHGLLKGEELATAIEMGQGVAAFVVGARGDHLGAPTLSELEGFLAGEGISR